MRKIWKKIAVVFLGVALALNSYGVYGVYNLAVNTVQAAVEIDILDYERNPSAENYVINDIEGMNKLAELVNDGVSNFSGKTITLQKDLNYDKTVENNYKIIGHKYDNKFMGSFRGQNHTISGVNINSGADYMGIFGYILDGIVDGIRLSDSKIVQTSASSQRAVGGIAGYNHGYITNCIVMPDTEITGMGNGAMVGGIAGISSAGEQPTVVKCANYGYIKGASKVGGIVGLCSSAYVDGVNIEECCNFGTVCQTTSSNDVLLGGIIGQNDTGVVNCFNAGKIILGTITSNNCNAYVGGIAGLSDFKYSHILENSYNIMQIGEGDYFGSITCVKRVLEIKHCFWLYGSSTAAVNTDNLASGTTCDTKTVYEYSQEEMKAQALVDELNRYSGEIGYGEVWAADTKNVNNGYPVLKNVPCLENVKDNEDEDEPVDKTQAEHFYEDHNYNNKATNSTIRIYANGGMVTDFGSGEKKNYKSCTLFTDITASYRYTVDKKGTVKPSTGKVIVGVTSSNKEPTLVKGRIVDKDAAKIASASIKSGQITVTAKTQPGRVYLWVMDTGRAAESACIPVTVIAAPTATNLYAVPNTDTSFTYGKTKQFKSGKVNVGESIKVYLYPTYKQNGTVRRVNNVSYTASVDAKSSDYFSVSQSAGNPLCFEISAKGLKDGKSVSGRITFTCGLNGRKTVFTATATNQVTGISEGNVSGLTKTADHCFRITASDAAKTTGTFEMQTECVSSAYAATDNLKLYAMGSADGYDAARLAEGTVKITKKKSAAQGKISMKLERDKKTITVTAAKGTKPVTAYYLAVYNTVNSGAKKGYAVLSVTAE